MSVHVFLSHSRVDKPAVEGVSLSLDPNRTLRNLPAPALKAVKSCLFVGDNPSRFRGFGRIRSVSARRLPILKAVEVLPQAVGNGSAVPLP
jgi:hypothetical protein